ncbi:MAG TPA: sensor domain-containing protein [Actinomycetes bacterium]|nr:sensor domain-containing protein [Actinomycetes bacterium]
MQSMPWSLTTWRATANAALDLVVGVFVGTVLVTGIAVSVGLSIIGVGFLVALGTLAAGHLFGRMNRARIFAVLDVDIPSRPWPRSDPGTPRWRRLMRTLATSGPWKDLAHGLIGLVLGPLWFAVVISTWCLAFATVTFPIYAHRIPDGPAIQWGDFDPRGVAGCIAAGVIGVGLLFLAGAVARVTAAADVGLARALLGPSESDLLRAQVSTLTETRAAVVGAADEERRRIERDLHDGVQPQLVSLAMNIGLARRRLDTDPEGVAELLDTAHDEAKRAIVELRNVIRGVHPAVLTDRGLDPALSALAARSPVPVVVDVDPALSSARAPATIEAVAYFVVAEALTNVARHARATRATVSVRRTPTQLLVWVSDDGRGGAAAAPGSGLAGLSDRVAAVDGRLVVTSPSGGGTVVFVELPCVS